MVLAKYHIKIFEININNIKNNIKTDIRQWSAFNMDFETQIEVIKINVVPRLLYLFQSIPQMIPEAQFRYWDKHNLSGPERDHGSGRKHFNYKKKREGCPCLI